MMSGIDDEYQMTGAKPRILILSAFYCLIMVAYSSFNSILTKIREEDGDKALSPFQFLILYTVNFITNLFVSKVNISEKWQMVFATLGYSANYSTGFLLLGASTETKYILAAIGGLLNGIGSGFLFSFVGRYIHNTCAKYGELERKASTTDCSAPSTRPVPSWEPWL